MTRIEWKKVWVDKKKRHDEDSRRVILKNALLSSSSSSRERCALVRCIFSLSTFLSPTARASHLPATAPSITRSRDLTHTTCIYARCDAYVSAASLVRWTHRHRYIYKYARREHADAGPEYNSGVMRWDWASLALTRDLEVSATWRAREFAIYIYINAPKLVKVYHRKGDENSTSPAVHCARFFFRSTRLLLSLYIFFFFHSTFSFFPSYTVLYPRARHFFHFAGGKNKKPRGFRTGE